jgi:hypothetical protein
LTTGGLAALSHVSHPTPNRYTELGPENPFVYTDTIGLDQGLHCSLNLSKKNTFLPYSVVFEFLFVLCVSQKAPKE